MATFRELQEQNRIRQTGEAFPEILPPVPVNGNEKSAILNTTESSAPTISANDLIIPFSDLNRNYAEEAELAGYGESKYDRRSGWRPGDDIEDLRAREQSWGSKVVNGALKGAVTFGTTYANSTAGFVSGAATTLFGYTPIGQLLETGDARSAMPGSKRQELPEIKEAIQSGVNNSLSQTLVSWQRMAEDWFPNYRTAEERTEEYQRQWMRPSHLLSGNSIGDAFLKNLGFMGGAMAGVGSWQKVLGKAAAGKLAGDTMKGVALAADGDAEAYSAIKGAADAIKRGAIVANGDALAANIQNAAFRATALPVLKQLQYGVISAMGEGNAEGLMGRDEYLEEKLPELEKWFKEEYDSLEDKILHSYSGNRQTVFVPNENGGYDETYELTEAGRDALLTRQNMLFEEYRNRRQKLEQEANELSAVIFGLNIPILTISHLMQFSRILGGGWKSARKAAGSVTGRMAFDNAGNAVAKYNEKNVLRSIGRVASGISKVSGAEAAEEMGQGYVSSGAKRVADDRLTFYNDMGYDLDSLNTFKNDWLSSMFEGGTEYLSDVKNWQEGFMGALTGLLGMPGRGYFKGQRGGLAEAIVEAKQDINNWNSSAQKLNELVNDSNFQSRWRGYIRHLAFDDQIKNAVNKDDEYLFHWADDNQLFNDVMTFAKAGRIDDLLDVADRFSQLSPQDVQDIKNLRKETNNKIDQTSEEEIRESVQNQAEKLKKTVKDYNRIRNELLARLPVGSPEEMVDESIFTGLQVKNAEERFLGLLNETLNSLDGIFAAKNKNAEENANRLAELENLKSRYTKVFAGSLTPVDAATRKADSEKLEELKALVRNNSVVSKKVDDMIKLYQDRQKFFEKISRLENVSPGEYLEQAKNQAKEQQKATDAARKQEANDYAKQLDEKSGGIDTVEQMHRIYNDPTTNRAVFIDSLREKANDSPQAKQFVGLYDTFVDFRDAVIEKHPKIVSKRTGEMNYVANILLDQLFDKANSPEDFVSSIGNVEFDRAALDASLQSMVSSGMLTEEQIMPQLVDRFYDATIAAVNDVAPDFINGWKGTSNRADLNDADVERSDDSQPVDDNSNPAPATAPDPETGNASTIQGNEATEPEAEESSGQSAEDNTPEPISAPEQEDVVSDANSSYRDESIPEQQAFRRDSKGAVKYGYYQQTIPEVPTGTAREIRDLLLARKTASKEEMRAIDATLNSLGLSDFVVYDENGNPVGGEKGYAEIYKWLQDNGAFEYVSTKLKPGDNVVFAIMEGTPKYQGRSQVVVAAVKSRNADGEITEVQPLTILHSLDKTGDYMNLDELYDAIYADYDSSEPDGSLYIFGGKKNPKMSKVWGKRPGLMRYDRSNPGTRIDQIDSYDPDAPIMVIGDNNQPILLRGNIDISKIYMPNLYAWSSDHYGRLYYLAKSGDDGYAPIFIDKVFLTADMLNNAPDHSYLATIRDRLNNIDEITGALKPGANLDNSNERLRATLKKLNEYLNLDGFTFEYVNEADPHLNIHWVERFTVQGKEVTNEFDRKVLPGESLIPLFDDYLSRPVRLSPKEKWLNASKHHLNDIIEAGLLTSNALELRQVGVNFMYDPWDAQSKTFKQVLPSQRAEQKKSVAKAEPQVVSRDAELDDDTIDFAPQPSNAFDTEPSSNSSLPDSLGDFFGASEDEPSFSASNLSLDYSELTVDEQNTLKAKGVSEKTWDESDIATREHLLYC